mgnify:CR=1 FL=1
MTFNLQDAFAKLSELEDEMRGEVRSIQSFGHAKVSAPRKTFLNFFGRAAQDAEDDEDDDHEFTVIDAPQLPAIEFGDSDKDFDRPADNALVNPSSFQFVSRPVTWTDSASKNETETDLLNRYQKSKDMDALESLYARNKNFLSQQVYGLNVQYRLPKPAIEGVVYNNFKKAIDNWKPEKKANIRTFYKSNYKQNINRDMRQMAQFGRPERTRAAKTERTLQVAKQIEYEKGYVPSAEDIQKKMMPGEMTVKDIKLILQESRGDLLGSKKLDAEHDVDIERSTMMAIRRVRDYQGPKKTKVINHIFGLDGAEHIASNAKLAKKFNVTESQMSVIKRQLRQDIQDELRILGF